jgi:UPF0716 protein FxsA
VRRSAWVPLGALALFLAEALAFIGLGDLIGYSWAVLVVVLASVIGLVLVRREGLRAWRGFRQAVAADQPPGPQVTGGLVGLTGALLLAVPGLITGAAGLVLLAPPVRALARQRMQSGIERRMPSAEAGEVFGPRRVRVWQGRPEPPDGPVVEGEVVDPARRRGETSG